jgi:hypothetical protein
VPAGVPMVLHSAPTGHVLLKAPWGKRFPLSSVRHE